MADKLNKGKREIRKIEYLKNEKHFLDEIKSIFIIFEVNYVAKKRKVANTSFK